MREAVSSARYLRAARAAGQGRPDQFL